MTVVSGAATSSVCARRTLCTAVGTCICVPDGEQAAPDVENQPGPQPGAQPCAPSSAPAAQLSPLSSAGAAQDYMPPEARAAPPTSVDDEPDVYSGMDAVRVTFAGAVLLKEMRKGAALLQHAKQRLAANEADLKKDERLLDNAGQRAADSPRKSQKRRAKKTCGKAETRIARPKAARPTKRPSGATGSQSPCFPA